MHKTYPKVSFYRYVFLYYVFIKMPYVWLMMTWTRTHFVIDMTFGFAFAYLNTRVGEILSYYFDVSLCGIRAKDRLMIAYKPCSKCGWSNLDARRIWITELEKHAQAYTFNPKDYRAKLLPKNYISPRKIDESKSKDNYLKGQKV